MVGWPDCFKWEAGKLVRKERVGAAVAVEQVAALSPAERLGALGLFFASGSPTITIEELQKATIRVFKNAEMGYLVEAKLTPTAQPIYHYVSDEEAEVIKAGEITPEQIAHMFEPAEPVME